MMYKILKKKSYIVYHINVQESDMIEVYIDKTILIDQ